MRPTAAEVTALSQLSPSALLITGTVGPGQTSVAEAVGDLPTDAETAVRWHLSRAGELDAILDAARVEDFCVNAGTAPLPEVAAEVIRMVGWRGITPPHV